MRVTDADILEGMKAKYPGREIAFVPVPRETTGVHVTYISEQPRVRECLIAAILGEKPEPIEGVIESYVNDNYDYAVMVK
jgi:hypothetical protein